METTKATTPTFTVNHIADYRSVVVNSDGLIAGEAHRLLSGTWCARVAPRGSTTIGLPFTSGQTRDQAIDSVIAAARQS